MTSSNEIQSVCRFLAAKDITISSTNEWLNSCLDWFKTENAFCSVQQLQEFAYHQLLLADLSVVAEKCLPPGVSEARTTNLLGKYFLQINYVLDVGKSAYSQFQEVRKQSSVNLEVTEDKQDKWEPRPNRMLKIELTDGVTVVYGMEYSSISKINANVVPGAKIIVKGPVECRSGVILLQDKDIIVLGGEVDSLYDCNHYYRVITKTLNLDEHLLPTDDEIAQVIQQPAPPLEPKYSNSSQIMTELSSSAVTFSGDGVTSSESRNNNFNTMCNQQLQDLQDDYFADSDLFLNVPVDDIATSSEGACTKKKLIEVNACVTAFKSKLTMKDDNWSVIVRINSDEGSMKASIDPDLLNRLIGFSPAELYSKEEEIAVNPAIKEKMNNMLKRGQHVIKNLKCHMTLVHEEGSEFPVIISISDDKVFYDPSKF